MTLQLNTLRKVLHDASGPQRDALAPLVAEWTSFVGWLHTAVRKDSQALALFADAEDLADEVGDGTMAATAASFRGYLARLQGRPRSAIRASAAAMATPGADPTQHTYDLLQTAQAYADLGDKKEAQRFLAKASDLATTAGEPPPSVYWYTEPFFRLKHWPCPTRHRPIPRRRRFAPKWHTRHTCRPAGRRVDERISPSTCLCERACLTRNPAATTARATVPAFVPALRCRIEPYLIRAAALRAAAGPASAPGSALGGPAGARRAASGRSAPSARLIRGLSTSRSLFRATGRPATPSSP